MIGINRKRGFRVYGVVHVGDRDQLSRVRLQDLARERDRVSHRCLGLTGQVQ